MIKIEVGSKLIFIIIMLSIGCKGKIEKININQLINSKGSNIIIKIPSIEDNSRLALSEVMDSIGLVKLETTDESIIGSIDKLCIFNDKIIILDYFKGRQLMVFNRSGKFIKKIGSLGKGPGEYMKPKDMAIDYQKEVLYVFDSELNKMILYTLNSFDYIQEFSIDYPIHNFEVLSPDKLVINKHLYPNYSNKDIDDCLILFAKTDGSLNNMAFCSSPKNEVYLHYVQKNYLTRYKNEILFRPGFCDTIFSITHDKVKCKYVLDVGKHKMDIKLLDNYDYQTFIKEYLNRSSNHTEVIQMGDYYETDNHLLFSIAYKGRSIAHFYDKKSKNLKYGALLTDDLKEGFGGFTVIGKNNNEIIGLYQATDVERWKNVKNISKDKFTRDFIENNKPYDNPYLMFYTIKNF